jgi:hypothetical protein
VSAKILALLALLTPAAWPASPVLVELFTSQGCNSCPPADRLLAQLAQEQDIVVLSEHVDYWNYLGWRDPYSHAFFSQRQQNYNRRPGRDGVYTPQMIVDGRREVLGSDELRVRQAIAQAGAAPKPPLTIRDVARQGQRISATIVSPAQNVTLWIALADEAVAEQVTRGENSGRQLRHAAVVRVLRPAVHGTPLTLELPADAGQQGVRVVAFAQDGMGRVLAVSQVLLPFEKKL